MKKIISFTIAVFFIICFFIAFNTNVVENLKYDISKKIVYGNASPANIHIDDQTKSTAEKEISDNNKLDQQPGTNSGQAIEGQSTDGSDKTVKEQDEQGSDKAPQQQDEKSVDKANNEDNKNETEKIVNDQNNKPPEKIVEDEKRVVDPKKPMVALTFDDGPHPQYTMKILDSLKKNNGRATFFVLGSRAEEYKSTISSIAKDGNQIGNHTYDHKQLTKLSSKDIQNEITKTTNILNSIVNIKPDTVRPTYGSINNNVKLYAGAPLILWSIDTRDWKTKNKNMIVNEVMSKVRDGDIILMHDIYSSTADAAATVIKNLSSKGYQLVTVDELFKARGINLVSGKIYSHAHKKK